MVASTISSIDNIVRLLRAGARGAEHTRSLDTIARVFNETPDLSARLAEHLDKGFTHNMSPQELKAHAVDFLNNTAGLSADGPMFNLLVQDSIIAREIEHAADGARQSDTALSRDDITEIYRKNGADITRNEIQDSITRTHRMFSERPPRSQTEFVSPQEVSNDLADIAAQNTGSNTTTDHQWTEKLNRLREHYGDDFENITDTQVTERAEQLRQQDLVEHSAAEDPGDYTLTARRQLLEEAEEAAFARRINRKTAEQVNALEQSQRFRTEPNFNGTSGTGIELPEMRRGIDWFKFAMRRDISIRGALRTFLFHPFTRFAPVTAMRMNSVPIIRPIIEAADEFMRSDNVKVMQGLRTLQDQVLQAVENGDNPIKTMEEWFSANQDNLLAFEDGIAELIRHVQDNYATAGEIHSARTIRGWLSRNIPDTLYAGPYGRHGITQKQKNRLLSYLQNLHETAVDLRRGMDGENAQQIIESLENFTPSQLRERVRTLSHANYLANSAYTRLTGNWPDEAGQASAQWVEKLERSINENNYRPERFGADSTWEDIRGSCEIDSNPENVEQTWQNQLLTYYQNIATKNEAGEITHVPWTDQNTPTFVGHLIKVYDKGFGNESVASIDELVRRRHKFGGSDIDTVPPKILLEKAFRADSRYGEFLEDGVTRNPHYNPEFTTWADEIMEHADVSFKGKWNTILGRFQVNRGTVELYESLTYPFRFARRFRGTGQIATPGRIFWSNYLIYTPLTRLRNFLGGALRTEVTHDFGTGSISSKPVWRAEGETHWSNVGRSAIRLLSFGTVSDIKGIPGLKNIPFIGKLMRYPRPTALGVTVGGAVALALAEEGAEERGIIPETDFDLDFGSRTLGAIVETGDILLIEPPVQIAHGLNWGASFIPGVRRLSPYIDRAITAIDNADNSFHNFNRTVLGDRGNVDLEDINLTSLPEIDDFNMEDYGLTEDVVSAFDDLKEKIPEHLQNIEDTLEDAEQDVTDAEDALEATGARANQEELEATLAEKEEALAIIEQDISNLRNADAPLIEAWERYERAHEALATFVTEHTDELERLQERYAELAEQQRLIDEGKTETGGFAIRGDDSEEVLREKIDDLVEERTRLAAAVSNKIANLRTVIDDTNLMIAALGTSLGSEEREAEVIPVEAIMPGMEEDGTQNGEQGGTTSSSTEGRGAGTGTGAGTGAGAGTGTGERAQTRETGTTPEETGEGEGEEDQLNELEGDETGDPDRYDNSDMSLTDRFVQGGAQAAGVIEQHVNTLNDGYHRMTELDSDDQWTIGTNRVLDGVTGSVKGLVGWATGSFRNATMTENGRGALGFFGGLAGAIILQNTLINRFLESKWLLGVGKWPVIGTLVKLGTLYYTFLALRKATHKGLDFLVQGDGSNIDQNQVRDDAQGDDEGEGDGENGGQALTDNRVFVRVQGHDGSTPTMLINDLDDLSDDEFFSDISLVPEGGNRYVVQITADDGTVFAPEGFGRTVQGNTTSIPQEVLDDLENTPPVFELVDHNNDGEMDFTIKIGDHEIRAGLNQDLRNQGLTLEDLAQD